MDIWTWPAWAIGALFGGIGGGYLLGSLLETLTRKKGLKDTMATLGTVVAIALSVWQTHQHKLKAEPAQAESVVAASKEAADSGQ